MTAYDLAAWRSYEARNRAANRAYGETTRSELLSCRYNGCACAFRHVRTRNRHERYHHRLKAVS